MKNLWKPKNKIIRERKWILCLFFLLETCFVAGVWGQELSTPEEVSGVSMRDMNGLQKMSRDYSVGTGPVPASNSEDDQWIPDMSLASKSATAAVPASTSGQVGMSSGSIVPVSSSVSVPVTSLLPSSGQAPAVQKVSANSGNSLSVNSSVGTASLNASPVALGSNVNANGNVKVASSVGAEPVVKTASATMFNPGFQVGGENRRQDISAPSVPPVTAPTMLSGANSSQLNNSNKPFKNDSAGFAVSNSTAVPSSSSVPVMPPLSSGSSSVPGVQGSVKSLPGMSTPQSIGANSVPMNSIKTNAISVGSKTKPVPATAEDLLNIDKKNDAPKEGQELSVDDLNKCIVEDIRVSGLEMSTTKFNNLIKTRIGNKFNQQILEEDKRTLLQTRQFVDVTVSTSMVPDKPDRLIVNFDLTSRRLMQYVKILGNKAFSKTNLLEELGMKRGETRLDPYDVENGRLRIIELYKNKGHAEPHVEILRGDRPEDIGVVYLIDEGTKQRVIGTKFIGNTIVSSGRLKHLVSAKPGVFYFIGGDFSREILDEDVNKLLDYYRRLGYFDARVDRDYEEGDGFAGLGKENAWVTVTYIINEGPRYKIRNVYYEGNKVLDAEKIKDLSKVKSGDFYNQIDIEVDRIKIKNQYHNMGYVLADIVPAQVFTDEIGVLDLKYSITEKSRYRVRDILIDYDGEEARTKSTVIMNMLDIYPGMLLDGQKIKSSEASLRRSGYFNDKPSDGIIPTIKIVPDTEAPMPIRKADRKDDEKKDEKVIRGQVRQIPAGFGTTTTSSVPATGYNQPVTGYNQPATGYNQPATGYNQPATGYNQPVTGYNQPATGYNQPATGYNQGSTVQGSAVGSNSASPYSDTSGIYNGTVNTGNAVTSQAAPAYGATVPAAQGYSGVPAGSYNSNPYNPNLTAPTISGAGTSGMTGTSGLNGSALGSSETPGFIASSGISPQDPIFPRTPQSQDVNGLEIGALDGISNADVVAQVREGRTGMIQASVGVNSDYGLVGNVSLTERNFDLFRFPTSCSRADGWTDAFRGGGQIFQIQASPGTEISRYSVSWDVPYVFNTKYSFGTSASYGDRDYTDWFETRYGGELRFGRQWTPRFSSSVYTSAYDVRMTSDMYSFVPDVQRALGKHSLYTLGLSGSYDTRNHPFLPSEGGVVSASIEQVFGDYQYPRAEASARKYFTLHERWDKSGRWTLGLKTSAGWMDKDAPIFERFYAGGTTFRGFEYREVTPRYGSSGFGIGGNFEFFASAELLVPVSGGDEFMLAFFLDTGTVSRTIKDWETYRVAPGFGFRIAIPMLGPAPLALDFAFPISKGKRDLEQVFSFSVVGSR